MLTALVLVALCAAYDFVCGQYANGLKRIAVTAVLAFGIWAVSLDPVDAGILAVGIYIWRSRPLGRVLAVSREDMPKAVLRHLWALAAVPGVVALGAPDLTTGIIADVHAGGNWFDLARWAHGVSTVPVALWALAALPLVAFAFVAARLSYENRINAEAGRDINPRLEATRGASIGAAIFVGSLLVKLAA